MTSQRHNSQVDVERSLAGDRPIPPEVLDATRATVLAVGVRRTTLTDVARRAGVSRMTLYRLPPHRTALFPPVITREFSALLAAAERDAGLKRSARARIVATTVDVARRLPQEPLFQR